MLKILKVTLGARRKFTTHGSASWRLKLTQVRTASHLGSQLARSSVLAANPIDLILLTFIKLV